MELTEHRKYALIVLGLFFLWGGVSFYWYTCGIKGFCGKEVAASAPIVSEARGGTQPELLTPPQETVCPGLITTYITQGRAHNPAHVEALEQFLNTYEGEDLPMDGIYGSHDIAAVKRFQNKYRSVILAPYGLKVATGNVHEATLYVINTIYCDSIIKQ
ncbi:MAG: hypothetical protein RI911_785 [Candidatus Parcubacteria bacterium]|jgi:hypothetical protein